MCDRPLLIGQNKKMNRLMKDKLGRRIINVISIVI